MKEDLNKLDPLQREAGALSETLILIEIKLLDAANRLVRLREAADEIYGQLRFPNEFSATQNN